jgi:hypothetical protein
LQVPEVKVGRAQYLDHFVLIDNALFALLRLEKDEAVLHAWPQFIKKLASNIQADNFKMPK